MSAIGQWLVILVSATARSLVMFDVSPDISWIMELELSLRIPWTISWGDDQLDVCICDWSLSAMGLVQIVAWGGILRVSALLEGRCLRDWSRSKTYLAIYMQEWVDRLKRCNDSESDEWIEEPSQVREQCTCTPYGAVSLAKPVGCIDA